MKRLPLSALEAFEAAARTGSFRAAGEELGISPSAISHAVRKLETLMGPCSSTGRAAPSISTRPERR
jgi:LysR family glycine cleavage system transcriptional activator